ncbi:uncharacterized protein SCDLUD_002492 [Saccharomycodes ludwigii]|uniref:uncharacterized protein n=1 Tax=Saccharomycodes ludwigii TaxID=36035 RepID=UPI001E838B3D|nr:hypothetical protein SCDLUD_002492 [Saccharomycodes ludwigii]KAH3901025.1 hypothetical protein SCDLUD_002492 [Saccharomycodes ludwigii]
MSNIPTVFADKDGFCNIGNGTAANHNNILLCYQDPMFYQPVFHTEPYIKVDVKYKKKLIKPTHQEINNFNFEDEYSDQDYYRDNASFLRDNTEDNQGQHWDAYACLLNNLKERPCDQEKYYSGHYNHESKKIEKYEGKVPNYIKKEDNHHFYQDILYNVCGEDLAFDLPKLCLTHLSRQLKLFQVFFKKVCRLPLEPLERKYGKISDADIRIIFNTILDLYIWSFINFNEFFLQRVKNIDGHVILDDKLKANVLLIVYVGTFIVFYYITNAQKNKANNGTIRFWLDLLVSIDSIPYIIKQSISLSKFINDISCFFMLLKLTRHYLHSTVVDSLVLDNIGLLVLITACLILAYNVGFGSLLNVRKVFINRHKGVIDNTFGK